MLVEIERRFLVPKGRKVIIELATTSWSHLRQGYFGRVDRIALAILLVDSRHPPFESDLGLGEALAARGIPYLVVLTKADRSTMSERARAGNLAREAFVGASGAVLTSAKTGAGLPELARRIDEAVEGAGGGSKRGLPGREKSGNIKRFRGN